MSQSPKFRVWHKQRQQYFDDPKYWGNSQVHLEGHLFVNMEGCVFWLSSEGLTDITEQCEVHWQNEEKPAIQKGLASMEELLARTGRGNSQVRIVSVISSDESPMLSEQVAKLEARAKNLDELCGEMHATIEVNILRGGLKSADDDLLNRIIEGWKLRRANA